MPLFKVTMEIELICEAKDFDAARMESADYICEEAGNLSWREPGVVEWDPAKDAWPADWNDDCLPYGGDGRTTIKGRKAK